MHAVVDELEEVGDECGDLRGLVGLAAEESGERRFELHQYLRDAREACNEGIGANVVMTHHTLMACGRSLTGPRERGTQVK